MVTTDAPLSPLISDSGDMITLNIYQLVGFIYYIYQLHLSMRIIYVFIYLFIYVAIYLFFLCALV